MLRLSQQRFLAHPFLIIMALVSLFASTFCFPLHAYAKEKQNRLDLISQSCSSIKIQLKNVQRNDSKTRTRLGSYYEFISNKMIMNLNLRLVKNNIAAPELTKQQSDFSDRRKDFKEDFVRYSQQLEELIAINCEKDAKSFDAKLSETRHARAKVARDVAALDDILTEHEAVVWGIIEDMKGSEDDAKE